MKKIFIYVYALLFSTLASAESILTNPPTDKLDMIFGAMFGRLGVFGTNGSNPFLAQMKILDSALLVFAGIISTYLVCNWVMKTAHEGENGKKAASGWHLMRWASACALIIPPPGLGGYSTSQLLAATTVKMGISLAYNTANALFDGDSLKEIATSNLSLQKVDSVAHNLFLSSVCVYAYQDFYKQNTFVNSSGNQVPKFGKKTERGMFTDDVHFGQISDYGQYDKDICGTYSIHRFEANNQLNASIQNGSVPSIAAGLVIDKSISDNNAKLAAKLLNDIDKLGKEFITKKDFSTYQKAIDAGAEYSKNSRDFAFNLIKNDTKVQQMSDAVKNDGSLYVGAYYMRISDLQSRTNAAIAKVPTATGIKKIDPSLSNEIYSELIKPINSYGEKLNSPIATFGINTIDGNKDSGWWESIKATFKGDPNVILKKLISSGTAPFVFDERSNLVSSVQALGGWALGFATTLLIAGGMISMTAGIHPGIASYTKLIMEIFAPSLLLFGSTALFITPMIPFYVFIGAMIAWICSATATILIANFIPICMMFAGNDAMGQGSNAFKQLLSIVFKPALLVISFAAAIVLTNLIGQTVMSIFMSAWNLSQDNAGIITYLISIIFLVASFALFSAYLVYQIFMICMKLPDQMISFLGGNGIAIAGEAMGFGSAGGAFAGGVAGSVAGAAMKERGSNAAKNGLEGSTSVLKNKAMGNTSPSGSGDSGASGGVAGKEKNANSLSAAMNANSASDSSSFDSNNNELDADNENNHSFEDFNVDDYEGLNDSTKDNAPFEAYNNALKSFKDKNPNASETEAKFYATDSAISWKYGSGAGKAVAAAGSGSYNNEDAKLLYKMYDTASNSNFSRDNLKSISKEINENNLTGNEALQSFSKKFAEIQSKKDGLSE